MNPDEAETVEELMARADKAMYENKRKRKTSQPLAPIEHFNEAVA